MPPSAPTGQSNVATSTYLHQHANHSVVLLFVLNNQMARRNDYVEDLNECDEDAAGGDVTDWRHVSC